jgi:predicted permease
MSLLSRFTNLFRDRALNEEFDDELRFHLEMRIEKNMRRGMPRHEAEQEARRHLGSTLRAKEGMREANVMMWIETLFRDLSYGARMFSRQPASTALAVITLSLGIGANTVIYSLLHAALLQPLPFPEPERLVGVMDTYRIDGTNAPPTIPEILDVRAASRTLELVSFFDTRDAQIHGGAEPARAFSARIEADFFKTLRVQPALGRLFTQADHEEGRVPVVVLSDSFWRRTFGADPSLIARNIIVNGSPHTVVGVLAPGVSFDYFSGEPIELYVPYPMDATYTSRSGEFASVRRVLAIARLKSDATTRQAIAELDTIAQRLRTDHASLYRRGSDGQDLGFSMTVEPLRRMVVGGDQPVLLMLFAAVGLVLLIACVNTAQFLLARAVERQPEVLIRTALGAGSGRLLRQFLTEALLLAVIAAALGVLQARSLIDLLRAALPSVSPLAANLTLNYQVILFTLGITVAVTLVCGLFPAIHVIRRRFVADAARLAGSARSRARHAMVAVQVAVSMVLLVAAGLLAQAMLQLQNAPSGYDPNDVTVMRLRIAGRALQATSSHTGATYQQYIDRIAAIPGVAHVAVADAPLPGGAGMEFAIIGKPGDAAALAQQRASWRIASAGYFNVLGIPLLRGRTFEINDSPNGPPVAIINDTMARKFWPEQDPIGQQIRSGAGPRQRVATIIGVVGDVRPPHLIEMVPQIYVSALQQAEPNITLMVKVSPGATVTVDAIKQAIWSVVSAQPLYDIQPLTAIVERRMASPRLMTQMLGGFAVLAMLMSTLGVYTIVSYLTARRTKEVALRRAIGATPQDVMQLLGLPTLRWTAVGVMAGAVAAAAAANTVSAIAVRMSLPPGATQLGPSLVAIIAAGYVLVVGIAVLVPAARALRVQPAEILRAE